MFDRFIKDQNGGSLISYAAILALVAGFAAIIVPHVGQKVSDIYGQAAIKLTEADVNHPCTENSKTFAAGRFEWTIPRNCGQLTITVAGAGGGGSYSGINPGGNGGLTIGSVSI